MNEIEEFLRRAAALRNQQAQPAQQRSPAPAARPVAPAQVYTPPRLAPSDEILDAEVIDTGDVSGDDVAHYVKQHLSPREFEERSQHAAERIRLADDAMEAHLHDAFEHRLGALGATTSRAEDSTLDDAEAAAAAQPPQVPDLVKILRSPRDLRNAIILNELLTPPTHRW
jgi:hypothetical protein